MNELIHLDHTLFQAWNGSDCLFLDGFMWVYSELLTWLPVAALLLWIIFRNFSGKQVLWIFLLLALLFVCSDQLTSSWLKPSVGRLRPTHDPQFMSTVNTVFGYTGGRWSFPSSHAANAFALVGFTVPLIRRSLYTWVMIVWAVTISYSRIYLGVHFPSDILAGTLIGSALGALFYLFFRLICSSRNANRNHPLRHTRVAAGDVRLFVYAVLLTHIIGMAVGAYLAY